MTYLLESLGEAVEAGKVDKNSPYPPQMKGDRITSYNVCYTKLLRSVRLVNAFEDSFGETANEYEFDLD